MASRSPLVRPHGRVTVAHYPPGVTWGPRVMTDVELVWILSGSATWVVTPPGGSRTSVHLRPGTLALSRPGIEESYSWDPARHSSHAFVHLTIDRPEVLAPWDEWPLTRSLHDHPVLAGLCDHLLLLADLSTADAEVRTTELLTLLVDLAVRGPLPTRGTSVHSPVVAAALEVVRARWAAEGPAILAVGDLAATVGVSATHLSREFHRQFRTGIAGALELVRLSSAALTLQRTNMTLHEVARSCGFADAYHLSRRFSRAYGLPPGRFRRTADADPLRPLVDAGLGPVWGATLGSGRGSDQTNR